MARPKPRELLLGGRMKGSGLHCSQDDGSQYFDEARLGAGWSRPRILSISLLQE